MVTVITTVEEELLQNTQPNSGDHRSFLEEVAYGLNLK